MRSLLVVFALLFLPQTLLSQDLDDVYLGGNVGVVKKNDARWNIKGVARWGNNLIVVGWGETSLHGDIENRSVYFFGEYGKRLSLGDKVHLQGFIGLSTVGVYLGSDLTIQLADRLGVSLYYKQKQAGVGVYFSLLR